jgi:uncharacterized protein YkwD
MTSAQPVAARMARQPATSHTSPLAITGTATASRMRATHSQRTRGR